MIRTCIRLIVIGLVLMLPLGIATAQSESDTYTDPEGLYSFPVPANWIVTEEEGYVKLTNPDEELLMYFFTTEDTGDADAIIAAGWEMVNPGFDMESIDRQEITDPVLLEGFDSAVVITYSTTPRVVQAVTNSLDGIAYVVLLDLDLVALQQRAAQVQIVLTGMEYTALEQTDLTGIETIPFNDEMAAELDRFIPVMMELGEVPGLSVAIVQGDKIVYQKGFGVLELGSEAPVTPETLMMIGSTTKTMTTMFMGALIDEGLMTWDTPVVEIMPEFSVADPEMTKTLTVRNLVCACTGVPRRDLEIVFNQSELTAEDIVEQLASFEFFTDFGEAFQYSNQMVATGGYVAAEAAGTEYGNLTEGYLALMQEYIFDKIGMPNTTFSMEEAIANENSAIPHGANLDNEYYVIPYTIEDFVTPIAPAGAVWSNVLDMSQYLITLLNDGTAPDGTQVVSAENLHETWMPQVQIDAKTEYGLGWIIEDYDGVRVLSHGGNTLGFTSEMAFVPDTDLGIVVLTNARGTNTFNNAVRVRLLEMVFDQEPEIEAQINAVIAQIEANSEPINYGELDEEAVTPYLGEWENPALGMVTLSLEEGEFLLDAGEWITELRPILNDNDELLYYIMFDSPLAGVDTYLATDENGDPQLVVGSNIIENKFTRPE